ncbi:metallophosphoesterase [Staphylococcus massiliensis]|uniref:Putative serine/threonine protein phosphatase n=1 Tax=Staphylococcus massiliensis S46 TaxID=1229783 RepID=K9AVH8_9STAP|nr:metallophosphoesterase [Staphylococcus massiliensis]EKU50131.1 putative serine/threonine protein phosphatase [Staphylococcus massiliensis S46]MCG3400448.1 metallophosphoesterase [Staphylococcus massiliensis]MCG3402166.1 metallophosphoesterase [Staphylococcus massiliensis]MCG3412868.1 metallophosphoesterase [Staphylococcus massiliensis]POA00825.1 serine/threonine protein phosphatase [Staphylococcus massiliensis CCUG 55927]
MTQHRLLAISDIHGHKQALQKLLHEAQYSSQTDQLVLLGDYVNKGPDSTGTLEYVEALVRNGAKALIGNHELKWIHECTNLDHKWVNIIGRLDCVIEHERYIFVHAGIDTRYALNNQPVIRATGYEPSDYIQTQFPGKCVVHGHVPTFREGCHLDEIVMSEETINIDTGAGHGYYLTLLDITNEKTYSINVNELDSVKVKQL